MNHVWQHFFWTHELPHQQKKSNHHLTIHHHLQQLHTFPANFLPFNLFFCFPKKSKKLFRLKEDKTWLRMFLKLIAWISLIVTRSKGRHLRFCRWIPSGGFRVGVFLGVVWPFFLYERPDVLLRDLWLFNAVFVWWCLYVLKHMSTSGVQMIYGIIWIQFVHIHTRNWLQGRLEMLKITKHIDTTMCLPSLKHHPLQQLKTIRSNLKSESQK